MMHAAHTWCSHRDTNSRDKYQWLWTERMAGSFFIIGTIIVTQTVVGILGNFSLLCSYIILHSMGYRLRSTDLILKHLIVANSLVLLCKGVPETMAVFGWKQIRSDFGCKLLFFLHRMGRGVSIGSICLLSVFQVIAISPWNSRWAALKVTAPKYVVLSLFLCWILQMLVNVIFPFHITGKLSDKNITKEKDFSYCFNFYLYEMIDVQLNLLWQWFHDVSQIFMPYTLNLHDAVCLLYFNKTGKKIFILFSIIKTNSIWKKRDKS